jgi:hypothetical protein
MNISKALTGVVVVAVAVVTVGAVVGLLTNGTDVIREVVGLVFVAVLVGGSLVYGSRYLDGPKTPYW